MHKACPLSVLLVLDLVFSFATHVGYAEHANPLANDRTIIGEGKGFVEDTSRSFSSLLLALNPASVNHCGQTIGHRRSYGPCLGANQVDRISKQGLGFLSLLYSLPLLVALSTTQPAFAEDELAILAKEKSTAELVKPGCIAEKCKTEMEACAADKDCTKGMLCAAKCMGNTKCTVGCFARYDDQNLENILRCTIEDSQCIQIGTQELGPDSARGAPKPPKPLIKATPDTMKGRWYKVIGFNPNYDCYDCQRNSFYPGKEGKGMLTEERSIDIGPDSAVIKVEYSMPRERQGAPPTTFTSKVFEKLDFDQEPDSVRTAHTEGRMFGLTFWENWYVIGSNNPGEPEFRFVWYTGKTLQNRYEGAFVYTREPEIPVKALPSIYKIAHEAGLDPNNACPIDNNCFLPKASSATRSSVANSPLESR